MEHSLSERTWLLHLQTHCKINCIDFDPSSTHQCLIMDRGDTQRASPLPEDLELVIGLARRTAAELWASSPHHLDTAGTPDTPEVQKLEDQNIQLMLDLSQVQVHPVDIRPCVKTTNQKLDLSLSECLQVVNGSQWGRSSCGLTLP